MFPSYSQDGCSQRDWQGEIYPHGWLWWWGWGSKQSAEEEKHKGLKNIDGLQFCYGTNLQELRRKVDSFPEPLGNSYPLIGVPLFCQQCIRLSSQDIWPIELQNNQCLLFLRHEVCHNKQKQIWNHMASWIKSAWMIIGWKTECEKLKIE